ncbi:hypothetical protein AGLY_002370 [Aphis glycines]|uniref:Uncharacterized protein n=1 Tax=Aphis glycines TaxID=307491 RepID=A0A6G0U468_APHGL|nr:hypothetical protein AGLY_002370 [Aphis glycines]
MIIFIKNLRADQIIKNIDLNFVSQLKMFAAPKLAEQRLRWSREMSPELFVDPISPLSPPIIPKKYSSPSPQYNDDNDAQPPPTKPWDITPRYLFSSCFFDGECSQLNSTQETNCEQNRESNPKLSTDPISPLSQPIIPKKYSSPSPQYNDDNDAQPPATKPWDITPRQLFSPCFLDGECSQINPTQATYCVKSGIQAEDNTADGFDSDNFAQYPPWYNNRVIHSPPSITVDENDGPTSFNKSPSILDSKSTKKRSAKRKLFFE